MENLAMDVAEGEIDAMDVYGTLQSIRKHADSMEKAVKQQAIDEAVDTWGADKEPVERNGFLFTYRSGGMTYKYDHIESWKDAKAGMVDIQEIAKDALKKGCELPNPETGEMIPPAVAKNSASSLSVKPL